MPRIEPLAHLPMLQHDVVATIASFLDIFYLRRSFIRVSKLWFEIGMDIVKGVDLTLLPFS